MSWGKLALPTIQMETSVTASGTTEAITVPGLAVGDHVIVTPRENAAGAITVDTVAANTLTVACAGNESGGTDIAILVIKKKQ
jgi:hypothetical protein